VWTGLQRPSCLHGVQTLFSEQFLMRLVAHPVTHENLQL
jgi:hypothetical protein